MFDGQSARTLAYVLRAVSGFASLCIAAGCGGGSGAGADCHGGDAAAAAGGYGAGAMSAGRTYTLDVVNDSASAWDFCLYQRILPEPPLNSVSLAWLVQSAAPLTTLRFQWQTNYAFVWSMNDTLETGAIFFAAQTWPANPSTGNQVTLDQLDSAALTFSNVTQDPLQKALTILQAPAVPPNQVAVGVAIGGSPALAVLAMPNGSATFPVLEASLWLTFAPNLQLGQVLPSIPDNQTNVIFPAYTHATTATLNSDDEWSFSPSPDGG